MWEWGIIWITNNNNYIEWMPTSFRCYVFVLSSYFTKRPVLSYFSVCATVSEKRWLFSSLSNLNIVYVADDEQFTLSETRTKQRFPKRTDRSWGDRFRLSLTNTLTHGFWCWWERKREHSTWLHFVEYVHACACVCICFCRIGLHAAEYDRRANHKQSFVQERLRLCVRMSVCKQETSSNRKHAYNIHTSNSIYTLSVLCSREEDENDEKDQSTVEIFWKKQ